MPALVVDILRTPQAGGATVQSSAPNERRTAKIDQEAELMEEHRQPLAAAPTTVALTAEAADALAGIVVILRDLGFRVKTAALVEAALVELHDHMSSPGKAVEIVRRRVPPKSVVLPP